MSEQAKEVAISLPKSSDWMSNVKNNAVNNMEQYESCSQSILAAFMTELGIENPMLFRSAGALAGGLFTSLTCGVHLAGMMVLGLILGREDITKGLDGIFPIIAPAQDLIKRLNTKLGSHSCMELTGVDFTDMEQAAEFYNSDARKKCIARVGDGAQEIAVFLKEMDERGELFRVV